MICHGAAPCVKVGTRGEAMPCAMITRISALLTRQPASVRGQMEL